MPFIVTRNTTALGRFAEKAEKGSDMIISLMLSKCSNIVFSLVENIRFRVLRLPP